MSGDVQNSQAVRDAERAATDLAQALQVGATLAELDELLTAKADAEERVASLRRRTELTQPKPTTHGPRRSAADLLERRQRRRGASSAETHDEDASTP
jgi:hypothetical protein